MKFRSAHISLSVKTDTTWGDWVYDKDGEGILITRDLSENKITVYGKEKKSFSLVTMDEVKGDKGYTTYKCICMDEQRTKCILHLYYAKDEKTDFNFLIIEYPTKRLRFAMEMSVE